MRKWQELGAVLVNRRYSINVEFYGVMRNAGSGGSLGLPGLEFCHSRDAEEPLYLCFLPLVTRRK